MTDATETKTEGAIYTKPWVWLVAAFAVLMVVGILTS